MKPSKVFEVFEDGKKIYTKNLVPGRRVYGENILKEGNVEYREWDPKRSKLAATIIKGSPNIGLRKGKIVLYLGASTGTTVSHVSDIVGREGFVFAIDFAPRVVRELVYLAENRPNIAPLLADANHPESYADLVGEVDVVFQDIAQKNQVEIFLRNCRIFLKNEGYGLLAVKARSIDVVKRPRDIFKEVQKQLEKEMTVFDYKELAPYEKDHCIFICKKRFK
ncbi:MAG: fibrillarin-like rRNA/tRNA 2'-O-methyltransferase [Candidatus Woesearchaeota archaeon]